MLRRLEHLLTAWQWCLSPSLFTKLPARLANPSPRVCENVKLGIQTWETRKTWKWVQRLTHHKCWVSVSESLRCNQIRRTCSNNRRTWTKLDWNAPLQLEYAATAIWGRSGSSGIIANFLPKSVNSSKQSAGRNEVRGIAWMHTNSYKCTSIFLGNYIFTWYLRIHNYTNIYSYLTTQYIHITFMYII